MSELKPFDEFMDALVHCDTVKVILTGCGESTFETKPIHEGICALANRRVQPANEPLTDHIADATEMVPLTLEGIREVVDDPDSDSAVWVNEINTDVWIRAILDEDAERGVFAVWHGGEDQSDFYTEKDYGKSWLAYAHRPGGEQE